MSDIKKDVVARLTNMRTEEIKKIAVIGLGMMGHAIAQEFASAGYEVKLCGRSGERLDLALKKIEQNLTELAEWDVISDDAIKPALSRLQTTLRIEEAASDADLVVESIIEDNVKSISCRTWIRPMSPIHFCLKR